MSRAEIAQSVEQLSRNQQVVGSIPIFGTIFGIIYFLRKTIDVQWSFVFLTLIINRTTSVVTIYI